MIVFIINMNMKNHSRVPLFLFTLLLSSVVSLITYAQFRPILEPIRVIQWNFQATFWFDNFRVVEIFHFLAFIK